MRVLKLFADLSLIIVIFLSTSGRAGDQVLPFQSNSTDDSHADESSSNFIDLHRKLQFTEQALFAEKERNQQLVEENSRLRRDQWYHLNLAMKSVSPTTAPLTFGSRKRIVKQAEDIQRLEEQNRMMLQTNTLLKDSIQALNAELKRAKSELLEYKRKFGLLNKL